MSTTQFTLRIDKDLKEETQKKANEKFGIGLGTLTKLFFMSFVDNPHITFYVGDKEFDEKLNELLESKKVKSALRKLGNAV